MDTNEALSVFGTQFTVTYYNGSEYVDSVASYTLKYEKMLMFHVIHRSSFTPQSQNGLATKRHIKENLNHTISNRKSDRGVICKIRKEHISKAF